VDVDTRDDVEAPGVKLEEPLSSLGIGCLAG
jgi:hypothetical protein